MPRSSVCVLLAILAHDVAADSPRVFRKHVINASARYSSCAAIDVNRDGKLDIVSGGFWYQAPHWTRHYLCDVAEIRGRFDDYANLPLDVNGDGWTDLISANYRSQTLYWIEHPGAELGAWQRRTIDAPGAMETGRLFDINGDGDLDVLPNGAKFAAWWQLTPEVGGPQWIRHDLPVELAGHGIGFGDMDGDGRGDLIGPRGWLQAPADRDQGRWGWRPEFQLDRDCSIPILVADVDGDRDADLVWGRGHGIGLYWLEQQTDRSSARHWVRHTIDTSWSQAHSLLLADIDGDQRADVIAGKRYLGHDGKDVGEYDPVVSYWYAFHPQRRTWARHAISTEGPGGFGVDPKAVDLDGDHDIDIVTADLDGLCWFENLAPPASPSTDVVGGRSAPEYSSHADVSVYRSSAGELCRITSPAEWSQRRAHILAAMQQVMGPLPETQMRVPLDLEILETVDCASFVRQKITFAAEPGDRVPAYLLLPKDQNGPAPAMLCLHQTTTIGKGEPAGISGKASLAYAHELAERGFVCLVPDYPSFGDYPYDFQQEGARYASGSMKAIWNNMRAIDVLSTRAEVDGNRIGCIGHSLGGHNGLFTAAFDLRIKAVVTSCGFTAFHQYYGGNLAGWTSSRYMPQIANRYQNDPSKMPFDFHEVLGAIAPRAVFVCAPLHDDNFEVAGVQEVEQAVKPIFRLFGAEDRLQFVYPDAAHDFPDTIRAQAYDWLGRQL